MLFAYDRKVVNMMKNFFSSNNHYDKSKIIISKPYDMDLSETQLDEIRALVLKNYSPKKLNKRLKIYRVHCYGISKSYDGVITIGLSKAIPWEEYTVIVMCRGDLNEECKKEIQTLVIKDWGLGSEQLVAEIEQISGKNCHCISRSSGSVTVWLY